MRESAQELVVTFNSHTAGGRQVERHRMVGMPVRIGSAGWNDICIDGIPEKCLTIVPQPDGLCQIFVEAPELMTAGEAQIAGVLDRPRRFLDGRLEVSLEQPLRASPAPRDTAPDPQSGHGEPLSFDDPPAFRDPGAFNLAPKANEPQAQSVAPAGPQHGSRQTVVMATDPFPLPSQPQPPSDPTDRDPTPVRGLPRLRLATPRLEVSLIWNDLAVCSEVFQRPTNVLLGTDPRTCQFVIDATAVGLPDPVRLFTGTDAGGGFQLHLRAEMRGEIRRGPNLWPVQTYLQGNDRGKFKLEAGDGGTLLFGDLRLAFEVLDSIAVVPTKALSERIEWPLVKSVLLMALLQLGFVASLSGVEHEPRSAGAGVPDRFIRLLEKRREPEKRSKKPTIRKRRTPPKPKPKPKPKLADSKRKKLKKMDKKTRRVMRDVYEKQRSTQLDLKILEGTGPARRGDGSYKGMAGKTETRAGTGALDFGGVGSSLGKDKSFALAGGAGSGTRKKRELRSKVVKVPAKESQKCAAAAGRRHRELLGALRDTRSGANACYDMAIDRTPDLQGSMKVRITVVRSGRVTDVRLRRSSKVRDPKLFRCIKRKILKRRLPQAASVEGCPSDTAEVINYGWEFVKPQ